jgi:uncharacterized peroxidase-related enzyme
MAWIEIVDEARAEGHLKEEYDAARRRAGKVLNILKVQSLRPRCISGFLEMYRAAFHGECALPEAEREMIGVVVSRANRAHYSLEVHTGFLADLLGDRALAVRVREDYRSAGLPARRLAILCYAEKLTRDPGGMEEADILALRAQGLGDPEILDVVELVSLFNFANRVVSALHADPEEGTAPYPRQGEVGA